MKTEIHNPYHVTWSLYIFLILFSILGMIAGIHMVPSSATGVSEMVKNISFGCFSSTLVALLIEVHSVKEKNTKANGIYSSVYWELQFRISSYIECWSQLCDIAFQEKNYRDVKHTWIEWYEETKQNYKNCNNRQDKIWDYFKNRLCTECDNVNDCIRKITGQYYMLEINDVLNENLKKIIGDFQFEFNAARRDLDIINQNEIWEYFDATNHDLERYISNWVDISYFNYVAFKPNAFMNDKCEVAKAKQLVIATENEV